MDHGDPGASCGESCTRCRAATLEASTSVSHEVGRSITTRTLACPLCGYRRTWLTISLDAA